jgi:hypothetical protein
MNLSRFARKTAYGAHYTLIARINSGGGKFPFVNVQFTKNHRPIPIEGATYYLRRSGGTRTPLKIGKDLAAAHAALLNMDDAEMPNEVREVRLLSSSDKPVSSQRKTVVGAAREYLERSKQKSRKTYLHWLPHSRQSLCPELQKDAFR